MFEVHILQIRRFNFDFCLPEVKFNWMGNTNSHPAMLSQNNL